jgi:Flp pilus assembly protein TadG
MRAWRAAGERGQGMVEFALTVGLLMLLVVLTAQLAIFLHYRSSLDTAAREGAFEAALTGHTPADGTRTTLDLWTKLEPEAGAIQVQAHRQGDLVVIDASGTSPALLPVPMPPYHALPIHARAVHTIERFQGTRAAQ